MADQVEGKDISLWVDTTRQTSYPTLTTDETVYDVVVVGGGITGVVVAYYLQEAGLTVALVEKNRIVEWTTGGTTAKLSSQHYLIYDYLIRRHGEAVARAFANVNERGIDEIERLSDLLDIDCDFSRRDAYVFSRNEAKVEDMKAEVEASKQLGLPASFETSVDLPFAVAGAVKFSKQAQFHPRKFLLPLAEKFVKAGGVLYEGTEVTDIRPGEPHSIETKLGDMRARQIVQASGEPFWGSDVLDGRMWLKMSYGLGVKLKDESDYPKSMYITTDEPMRTIRSTPYQNGQLLIFGGESHEYSDDTYDPDMHYKNLIKDVKRKYKVDEIKYRWLAGDYMPYDRIPYIGPLPEHSTIYVVTGYRAWGLAWAMSASHAIVGYAMKGVPSWARYFSLDRLKEPLRSEDKAKGF